MAVGPEANFWKSLRLNLPKKCHASRVENKHGGGIPDIHMAWDGLSFWIELKVASSNAIKLRPHQIAWNTRQWACGGLNYYLVKAPRSGELLLFGGNQGLEVQEFGCKAQALLSCGSAPLMFAALRPVLLARAAVVLRPAYPAGSPAPCV